MIHPAVSAPAVNWKAQVKREPLSCKVQIRRLVEWMQLPLLSLEAAALTSHSADQFQVLTLVCMC